MAGGVIRHKCLCPPGYTGEDCSVNIGQYRSLSSWNHTVTYLKNDCNLMNLIMMIFIKWSVLLKNICLKS